MWIRSQSRKFLGHYNEIMVVDRQIVGFSNTDDSVCLGLYKTEERAIEVIDDIENQLTTLVMADSIVAGERLTSVFVYQMPEK